MGDAVAARTIEGTFRSRDGLALFDRAWLPSTSPKAALIVVHGLKDHSQRYSALGEALAGRGWVVVAPDLRGHGRSEGRRAYVEHFDEYLDDLALLFEEVEKGHPGLPTYLFGHSMGGAIASLYALERRPSLRGLALSGAALRPPPTVSPFQVKVINLLSKLAPRAGVFKLKDDDFSRDPAVVRALREDPLVFHKGASARLASELIRAMGRIRDRSASLSVPLWVIHGTADRLTNPQGSEELFRAASSADKTFKPYPGLFHDLLHEPERAQVLGDLVAWFDSRLR